VEFRGLEALREKGQDIESVSFNPNAITLEGPAPVIEEIERNSRDVKLMSMDLSHGRGKHQELRLAPEVAEKQVFIQGRQFVDVKVDLREQPAERILKDVEILVFYGGSPLSPADRSRVELQQEKVNLCFTGPRSQIDFLLSDDKLRRKVMAIVNLSDMEVEHSKLTLDRIIEERIASPYTIEIKVYTESGFHLNPLIKVEPEQKAILVSRRAPSP